MGLLGLHARQQNPKYSGDAHSSPFAWRKCLACGLQERLDTDQNQLYADQENAESDSVNEICTILMPWQNFWGCIHIIPIENSKEN